MGDLIERGCLGSGQPGGEQAFQRPHGIAARYDGSGLGDVQGRHQGHGQVRDAGEKRRGRQGWQVDGKWMVRLDALTASTAPAELTITSATGNAPTPISPLFEPHIFSSMHINLKSKFLAICAISGAVRDAEAT